MDGDVRSGSPRDEFSRYLTEANLEAMREWILARVAPLMAEGTLRADSRVIVELLLESYLRGIMDACEHFKEVIR